ncbi:5'-nucleotidase [Moraxella sp. Tifton1]|uniref:5'-nucleotidase n=1 Tax=Moraxella oculi TaxID=2940516 RepID=UPI002012A721|nr:5'-nucleotidase [Moraxella sp. Tifton1]
MAVDFSQTLIVAISATALFDLTNIEAKYMQFMKEDVSTAIKRFREYMQAHENDPLLPGTGYPLIKALLNLNKYQDRKDYHDESPFVEVVIVSKSTPDMGIQVLNAIRSHGLNITRSAFISGGSVADYIDDFDVDLFLTTNPSDAQKITDAGVCACAILDTAPIDISMLDDKQLRIAFDGDAVLFNEASELVFQQHGLRAFHHYENEKMNMPMDKGPYADFLIKLSKLQAKLPVYDEVDDNPIRIALVTARNAPADMRAIKTLRAWGVSVDVAFFLGGLNKTRVLQTFAPHIFFDDHIKHINAARSHVPSAHVPYHSASLLNEFTQEPLHARVFKPIKKDKRSE